MRNQRRQFRSALGGSHRGKARPSTRLLQERPGLAENLL
jgi:hypothetical protein